MLIHIKVKILILLFRYNNVLIFNDINIFNTQQNIYIYEVDIPIFVCQNINNDTDDSIIKLLIPIYSFEISIRNLMISRVQHLVSPFPYMMSFVRYSKLRLQYNILTYSTIQLSKLRWNYLDITKCIPPITFGIKKQNPSIINSMILTQASFVTLSQSSNINPKAKVCKLTYHSLLINNN